MTKIEVVGFDVYGTMLPTEQANVKRKGLDELLERCKHLGLILCTCSDGKTLNVKKDLREAEINLNYFDKYFKMLRDGKNFTTAPKNFKPIIEYYQINPEKLLIIGDREPRDIIPARELGCEAILVPEYKTAKDFSKFDLNTITLP